MSVFKFKKFDVAQDGCAQKVGTDSMVLGAFLEYKNPKNIVDIGTGNGTLALMAAQKFGQSNIIGVEIEQECAAVAQYNFNNSIFRSRLKVVNQDINDYVFSEQCDLIISNPPFFENAMLSDQEERSTARHQSKLKLIDLIDIASNNLTFRGELWLIVPNDISENLIKSSLNKVFPITKRIKVFGKPGNHKRDILVFTRTNQDMLCDELDFTIRNSDGQYTDEYKIKTIDFHHALL